MEGYPKPGRPKCWTLKLLEVDVSDFWTGQILETKPNKKWGFKNREFPPNKAL